MAVITHEFLSRLIRDVILDCRTGSWTSRPNAGREPVEVHVVLSPDETRRVIERQLLIPPAVDSVQVRLVEEPARVNEPSGRYMCSIRSVVHDGQRVRRSIGRAFLAESAGHQP